MLFKNNRVIAAPMAGISESVFRKLCREKGADIVVSEMVSVDAIVHGSEATMDLIRFDQAERPIGIQLFGADPDKFRKAATLVVERFMPDFIDLNAGCPVQKVTRKNGGASLLKDFDRFASIVRNLVESVPVPVTVKLRSGWHKYQWIDIEFARCVEDCGGAAIFLHPRSQTMGFSGHSFWERITEVKNAVSIPVIGNGDIYSGNDAADMLSRTGCDGIMIGRASCGNPWIFSEIKAVLDGNLPKQPDPDEKLATVLRHIREYREKYGEYRASREMKKHVAWYIKGMDGASRLRDLIFRSSSTVQYETILSNFFRC